MEKSKGLVFSSIQKVLRWSRSHSLWYYPVQGGCCADEVYNTFGGRYDIERFGCLPQVEPRHADLLIVTGGISLKAKKALVEVYEEMVNPKYVMAIGTCACGGGPFQSKGSMNVWLSLEQLVPVDVYVPGCPPRPEAIMNGIISLQEKIKNGD